MKLKVAVFVMPSLNFSTSWRQCVQNLDSCVGNSTVLYRRWTSRQRAPQTLLDEAGRAGPAAVSQHADQVRSRELNCRSKTKSDTGRTRRGRGRQQHAKIDSNMRRPR